VDERGYWVVLNTAAGIGPVRFQRLLETCGSAEGAWRASEMELAAAGLERRTVTSLRQLRQRTSPEAITDSLGRLGIGTRTLLDPDYPPNLRQVADPPPVLFVRGRLSGTDRLAVALVGTRRATEYGRAVADRLARDLAAAGVTIVSGLAKGVDTLAHRAALQSGGRTIAVLGNGLDQVYPPENAGLARQIAEGEAGAIVSEFPPGVPPDAVNFPRRNRIISGLSLCTVIVEAGEKSGALITADFALEQGRDVFAVPGSIFNPNAVGSNQLLRQGAIPATSADDILETIGLALSTAEAAPLAGEDSGLQADEVALRSALAGEPRHVDDLARTLGVDPGTVSATLAILELKGLARRVGSMLYTRA
jgi:DNA processing protein